MRKEVREPCAFCPETADITGEHIWSAWAGRMFGERRYTITRKELDGRVRAWKRPHLGPKTNVVCGNCNNGWMSDLETRVKPIIGDMVCKCNETTLHDKDIATIAVWAYTKAIVAEHSHNNRKPFFTFAERQLFRQTLSIPNGVQIWLASMPVQHGLFKSYVIETPLNAPRRFELNVFTYGLGHFVIQAVTARWNKKALRWHTPPPVLTQAIEWDSCSIPFWPRSGAPISWPPAGHMSHQVVDAFVQRWTQLIRGGGFLLWHIPLPPCLPFLSSVISLACT